MTIRFTAPVRLAAAAAGKPRKLFIVGYTGGVMRVAGFDRIAIDLTGLELPDTIPVLADHDATLSGVIGPGKPSTDGRQLLVEAELAETPAAETVLSILESGVELQASIGGEPLERESIPAGETVQVNGQALAGPFTLMTRTKLKEMTVTPLGADDRTSVSLAARAAKGVRAVKYKAMLRAAKASGDENASKFSDEEIDKMSEDDAKAALKKCMAQGADDEDEDADSEKPASAKAVLSLMHGMPELQAKAAAEGWNVSRCKTEALHHLRASRPTGFSAVAQNGGNGFDPNDAASAALIVRTSGAAAAIKAYGERTVESVRAAGLDRMPFAELFAVHLRANNIDPGPRRDLESMIRANGGPSSASLANLLSNTLNKNLEMQWPQAPGTWRSWCAIRPAKDFKPAKSLRPVFNGSLDLLSQGGEITHGNLTDSMIEWQLYSFAKMFTIARQMIINDDLAGLQELPTGLALMADRAVSDLAYYNLLNNTGTFFSTGNGNNQSGGPSALGAASLTVAIKQMRLQRGPNLAPLNIPPATLIVGPSLEQTAKELLHSSFQFRNVTSADRLPAGNPLEESLTLVVEPRLELGATNPITPTQTAAGVAAQWFVMAGPTFLPAIMGFLNGADTPTIQMADPLGFNFEIPGMSWRCIYDFGFSLGDFRAAQRSVGS